MTSTRQTRLPSITTYVSTFLNKEMLHVYRQVCGLQHYNNIIIARTIKNRGLFPYNNLIVLKKHPFRAFHRLHYKILHKRVPLGNYEIKQIRQCVQQTKAKLIHIYIGTEAARLIKYIKSETIPIIVSFHGADLSNSLSEWEFNQLLRHTSLFLARSDSLKQALIKRGCPEDRIRLNPTGVPVSEQYPKRNIDTFTPPFKFLQACRFNKKKGLDVTICAIEKLTHSGLNVHLDLAGSGNQTDILKQLVDDLGIQDKVNFLGFLDNQDLLKILPRYHLFIHPSRTTSEGDREGIPNSILEAMAAGLPVVTTRHSGIPEAITDGIEGVLIEKSDCDDLVEAIKRAMNSNEHYQNMSRNAWKKVKDNYSEQNNTKVLEAIYSELCDEVSSHD